MVSVTGIGPYDASTARAVSASGAQEVEDGGTQSSLVLRSGFQAREGTAARIPALPVEEIYSRAQSTPVLDSQDPSVCHACTRWPYTEASHAQEKRRCVCACSIFSSLSQLYAYRLRFIYPTCYNASLIGFRLHSFRVHSQDLNLHSRGSVLC